MLRCFASGFGWCGTNKVAEALISEVLRKCMTALSPEHREIVDLVYNHERSVEEVAEIVGIPENTVKTRLFYAGRKLAELLKAAGIERGWP
jgi:RNA polymerase sigma-70 factor (ECF subfamily)